MRLVIFRSLLVLTVGATILGGVLYVASTVDARSPEVLTFELTQSLPDDPDTALITTSLEVAFSESVLLDAGTVPLTLSPHVDGTVSWSGSTMIFTPRHPLTLETVYIAAVGSGIRDPAGNRIGRPPPSFTFTTAGRPAVLETDPESEAREVPVEGEFRIIFSTLMDTATVEQALSIDPAIAFELRWSGQTLEIAPREALEPDREYVIRIGEDAADVGGVPLAGALALTFRTVTPGLEPVSVMPADGIEGIAPSAPLAVFFDRAVDPDSVSGDLFSITPDVAGSLEVVTLSGEPVDDADPGAGRILRFAPSGPLPLNTTFEVSLEPGLRALDGGPMAESLVWTFTTGAPAATLSNQITFISARAGAENVWAMNPDGSGQHQVSTELGPVLDYAVAPDGNRIVVADGRRLISSRADGSGRNVLTDDGFLEFDPSFSPNGQRLAFGRANAETGEGLGIWLASVDGDDAMQLELPLGSGAQPTPRPPDGAGGLRAPRFSPDGEAIAFVDVPGGIAILDLPSERLRRVDAHGGAEAPPFWLPDSSAIVVTYRPRAVGRTLVSPEGSVPPMDSPVADFVAVGVMSRSRNGPLENVAGSPAVVADVDRNGRVAYLDSAGRLHLADSPGGRVGLVRVTEGDLVVSAAFATGQDAMVIVVARAGDRAPGSGRVELLDLETGERTVLAEQGARPRWLP